mmetsp:Transcript_40495/g.86422  ORF Transcript_40495/g.86422 Transcript_40495/m.86422 type:complete len:300 (-) Transcript_40495:401-1300(-)
MYASGAFPPHSINLTGSTPSGEVRVKTSRTSPGTAICPAGDCGRGRASTQGDDLERNRDLGVMQPGHAAELVGGLSGLLCLVRGTDGLLAGAWSRWIHLLLFFAAFEGRLERLREQASEHHRATTPLDVRERHIRVAQDRVDGGEDLARGRDRRERERAEEGDRVVDEVLADSRCESEHHHRLDHLRVAHAEVEAVREVAGEEGEEGGDDEAGEIRPEHGLVHGRLGGGCAWVNLLGLLLDLLLQPAGYSVHEQRATDQQQAVRRIGAALFCLAAEVEDDNTGRDDQHLQVLRHRVGLA